MVINARTMGISQPDKELTSHDGALDEQYHRIKNDPHNTAGLPYEGTTQQIAELHMRHFIMRETPAGSTIAAWVNAMNEVAEGTRLGIPVIVAANSKNELGWVQDGSHRRRPGLHPVAGHPGSGRDRRPRADRRLRREVADRVGRGGTAQGLHVHGRHGHRSPVVPRQRHLRRGSGVQRPGDRCGGARLTGRAGTRRRRCRDDHQALPRWRRPENGFDPHYAEGKFNVYPTPDRWRRTTCRRSRRPSTRAPRV